MIRQVITFLRKLVPEIRPLLPTGLTFIHYWTDSPTSQYRNKNIFSLVSNHKSQFGVSAAWNYFEAGCGKGPCDGVGGTAKRLADQGMNAKKVRIQDANDFFSWASQYNSTTNLKYMYISKDECATEREIIQSKQNELRLVQGTMSLHAVAAVAPGKVKSRKTSCYCSKCFGEAGFIEPTECIWKRHLIFNTSATEKLSLKKDDWVAAIYDGKWYVGQGLEDDRESSFINFMENATGNSTEAKFKWPRNKDKFGAPATQIQINK